MKMLPKLIRLSISNEEMARIIYYRNLLVGILISISAGISFASTRAVDQLDEADRQEFDAYVARASSCSKAGDFQCASNALIQAKKYANGSRDNATLKAAAENIELMRQTSIQDDANRKYSAERAELDARTAESERAIAESRRAALANAERSNALQRQRQADKDRDDRQSNRQSEISVGAYIQQKGAETAAIMANVNRQVNAAVNESNRALAAQAAEREKARAERQQREAEHRRDAERDRSSRIALADAERQLSQQRQQAAQDRVREQELSRQKQAKEAADKLALDRSSQGSPAASASVRDSGSQSPSDLVQAAQGPGTADNPDDKGCFIPQRQPPECVVAEGRWARGTSGEYRVKYTNNCRARVYHYYAIEMKGGKWDMGSHGIPAGASQTWSTNEGTGRFTHIYTGSTRWGNDWVCTDRDPVFEAEYKRLTRK